MMSSAGGETQLEVELGGRWTRWAVPLLGYDQRDFGHLYVTRHVYYI